MSAPAALFAMGGNNNGGNGDCKKNRSGKCEYPKVKICHIPPGNPDNAHTITVSQNAVDAHLAHGDTLGACKDNGNNNDNCKKDNGKKNGKKKNCKKR
jgi:hypothetical protein